MSTDTAFVLGILALFGPRCPDRLRLFLLTLAIVDDIGAISVMALFYTDDLHVGALVVAAVLVAVLVGPALGRRLAADAVRARRHRAVAGRAGLRACTRRWPASWSACCCPPGRRTPSIVERTREYGRALREAPDAERARLAALAAAATVPPAPGCCTTLHRWTAYVVVPVFGLANAGVSLDGETLRTAATSPVTIGVAVALLVGNAIGITAGTAVALRTGSGVLPGGVRWSHLMAGATLAGIGFTISLFITDLAFSDEHAARAGDDRHPRRISHRSGRRRRPAARPRRAVLAVHAGGRGTTVAAAPPLGRAVRPGLTPFGPAMPTARRRAPSLHPARRTAGRR